MIKRMLYLRMYYRFYSVIIVFMVILPLNKHLKFENAMMF